MPVRISTRNSRPWPLEGVHRNASRDARSAWAFSRTSPLVARLRLEQARHLAKIDRSQHHRTEGCASSGEFGERFGLSAPEPRRLAQAAHAVGLIPENLCRLAKYVRRKERRALTDEEVFDLLVEHYLETYDVWAKKGGTRRLPDTRTVDGRTIPADVRR